MGARRRCCCECWLWEDAFTRSDNTDVGSDWTEKVGDWCITGNHLGEKFGGGGTANARIISTQMVPLGSSNEMTINVKVLDPQVGDIFRIYLALVDENDTDPYAEFEFLGGSPNWRITVHAGAESDTKDMLVTGVAHELHTGYTLNACIEPWDHDSPTQCNLRAGGTPSVDEYPWIDTAGVTAGRMFGLGHNNPTNGVLFDDFGVYELVAGSVICQICFCHCDGRHLMQKTLTLTITDATGDASCIDGDGCDLVWDWNAGVGTWYGEFTQVTPPYSNTFKWRLECNNYDPDNPFDHFLLTMDTPQICCSVPCDPLNPDPDLSTCDPLTLVFGPYSLTGLTCSLCSAPHVPLEGQYYVTITL